MIRLIALLVFFGLVLLVCFLCTFPLFISNQDPAGAIGASIVFGLLFIGTMLYLLSKV